VPTGSGRQRYSVLGALDAVTRTLVRETTDGTVTGVTAGRLLLKVRDGYPTGPITVVWDNARYQHTALVRAVAAFARIDLVYLPPYSPDLNLIERVWKFVKKAALANRSFADYPAFKAAIDTTLDDLGTTHKDAMATLLTLRFETLQKASDSTA
jgi:transposase